jgi:hypothetical protein
MVADESRDGETKFGEACEPNIGPSGEACEPNIGPSGEACEPNIGPSGEACEPNVRPSLAPFGHELATTRRRVDADAVAVNGVRRSP